MHIPNWIFIYVLFDFPQSRTWDKDLDACSLLWRWSQVGRVKGCKVSETGKRKNAIEGFHCKQLGLNPAGNPRNAWDMCKYAKELSTLPMPGCSIYSWIPISIGWRTLGTINSSTLQGCFKQLVHLAKAVAVETWRQAISVWGKTLWECIGNATTVWSHLLKLEVSWDGTWAPKATTTIWI